MPSSEDRVSLQDFGRLCALAREARITAIKAQFPPFLIRVREDHGLKIMGCVAVAELVMFIAIDLLSSHGGIAEGREWIYWGIGTVMAVGSVCLLHLMLAPCFKWIWTRIHPDQSFLSRESRVAALQAAVDPVAVARMVLEARLTYVRVEPEPAPGSEPGYRGVADAARARADFIRGLESLTTALDDPQRYRIGGEHVLILAADALQPEGEPLAVPIEARYAELVERRAASR